MADDKDPNARPTRDPAKHSRKDPAKPTRAKAAREQLPPIAPALEKLLNPGIQKGTAGPGSQTGLQPPPDNSFERRADFAAAHKARASTQGGFNEAPQKGYVGKTPLGPLDPDLARALGLDDEDEGASQESHNPVPALSPARRARPVPDTSAIATIASQQSLEKLLREGRPEFSERPWVPHRPPRPDKSEGGFRLVIKSDFEPKGDQPQAIAELVEGVTRHERNQVLLGVTGSGKTYTMAKVIEATQRPALVLAPNKTLAAQLYAESKSFLTDTAVE